MVYKLKRGNGLINSQPNKPIDQPLAVNRMVNAINIYDFPFFALFNFLSIVNHSYS